MPHNDTQHQQVLASPYYSVRISHHDQIAGPLKIIFLNDIFNRRRILDNEAITTTVEAKHSVLYERLLNLTHDARGRAMRWQLLEHDPDERL